MSIINDSEYNRGKFDSSKSLAKNEMSAIIESVKEKLPEREIEVPKGHTTLIVDGKTINYDIKFDHIIMLKQMHDIDVTEAISDMIVEIIKTKTQEQ